MDSKHASGRKLKRTCTRAREPPSFFHPRFEHRFPPPPPPFIRSTFSVISGNSSSRRFSPSFPPPFSFFFSSLLFSPTRCSRGATRSSNNGGAVFFFRHFVITGRAPAEEYFISLRNDRSTDPGICHCGSPPERFRHSLPAIISLPFDKLAARCGPVEVSPLRLPPFSRPRMGDNVRGLLMF